MASSFGNIFAIAKKQVLGDIYPIVALHFNFSPDGKDLLGLTLKEFDSQIKATGWLKIAEFEGGHILRFAGEFITPPFARKAHEWETTGGVLFQIRYRYGF